ncbi:MAG: SEC-C metal-binding domain-containing protein [Dehalococcoidales bacterium]|jgi:preprotein translocase subunit SecA|nr:SEC-C metal-binding domain-containing protein [Dehalococcoidales bacterium]
MDKVVSVRLPEEVIVWLSDASKLNKTTVSGMAKDIILSGYSAMKLGLMPAINELKRENEQLKNRQRLNELKESNPTNEIKVGRNAPCPCGSGKKYKHCCGK